MQHELGEGFVSFFSELVSFIEVELKNKLITSKVTVNIMNIIHLALYDLHLISRLSRDQSSYNNLLIIRLFMCSHSDLFLLKLCLYAYYAATVRSFCFFSNSISIFCQTGWNRFSPDQDFSISKSNYSSSSKSREREQHLFLLEIGSSDQIGSGDEYSSTCAIKAGCIWDGAAEVIWNNQYMSSRIVQN